MVLNKEDIIKLGKLAKLNLTEEQVELYSKQLSSILNYVKQMNEIDFNIVSVNSNVGFFDNHKNINLRKDNVIQKSQNELDDLMNCVPVKQNNQIKVPKVL